MTTPRIVRMRQTAADAARCLSKGQVSFHQTSVTLYGGPSYREEYMHSRAQNIDGWLSETEGEQLKLVLDTQR